MRSMTGFATARQANDDRSVDVELRSVNHRFLKLQVRLPRELQALEAKLEAIVRGKVSRGAVTMTLRIGESSGASNIVFDRELARRLHLEAAELAQETRTTPPELETILRLPGVVRQAEADENLEAQLSKLAEAAVAAAVDGLVRMREEEGERLRSELVRLKDRIAAVVAEVEKRAPVLVQLYQEKLTKRLNQLLAQHADRVTVLESDLLREVALFADRSDVSEELQRLGSHLEQFDQVIASDEVGRKLDFLLQEMLRETNTIASKAGDSEVARSVIEIKTDLERLREQAQNIE